MVVRSVNQSNVNRRALESSRCAQPAKAAADDHHPVRAGHVLSSFSCCGGRHASSAVRASVPRVVGGWITGGAMFSFPAAVTSIRQSGYFSARPERGFSRGGSKRYPTHGSV